MPVLARAFLVAIIAMLCNATNEPACCLEESWASWGTWRKSRWYHGEVGRVQVKIFRADTQASANFASF